MYVQSLPHGPSSLKTSKPLFRVSGSLMCSHTSSVVAPSFVTPLTLGILLPSTGFVYTVTPFL